MKLEVRNETTRILGWIIPPHPKMIFHGATVKGFPVRKMIGGFSSEFLCLFLPGLTDVSKAEEQLRDYNFTRAP